MRDSSNPHEPPPHHPPITARGLLAVAALIAAFPATLFAVEHPTAVATSLLLIGAVSTAVTLE